MVFCCRFFGGDTSKGSPGATAAGPSTGTRASCRHSWDELQEKTILSCLAHSCLRIDDDVASLWSWWMHMTTRRHKRPSCYKIEEVLNYLFCILVEEEQLAAALRRRHRWPAAAAILPHKGTARPLRPCWTIDHER